MMFFILLYLLLALFECVVKVLKCCHSDESYRAVLSCGVAYNVVQGGSNL